MKHPISPEENEKIKGYKSFFDYSTKEKKRIVRASAQESNRAQKELVDMTYKQHLKKWNNARELVKRHNEELIQKWRSIPWYRFWEKPSFEKQRSIIMDNWSEFGNLPAPKLSDYFPITL